MNELQLEPMLAFQYTWKVQDYEFDLLQELFFSILIAWEVVRGEAEK